MMLIGNDDELQLKLECNDSLQKVITQTMLNQEQIFKNQVVELHRLYHFQKILMKEQEMKVSGRDNLHSFEAYLKQSKCESMVNGMKLSEDLEDSSSHYSNQGVDPLPESYGHVAPQISFKTRHDSFHDSMSSVTDLDLNLRPVSTSWQKQPCKDKIHGSHPQESTHLHQMTCHDHVSHRALGFSIHVNDSGVERGINSTGSRMYDASERGPEFSSVRNEVVSVKSTSAKRKLFGSFDVGQLDLNEAPPDESCPAIDQSISSPSKVSSADVSYGDCSEFGEGTLLNFPDLGKSWITSQDEASTLDQQDAANSTLVTSPPSKTLGANICGSMVSSVDLGSKCASPSKTKDVASCTGNFSPRCSECELSCPEKAYQKISMSEMNDKKIKEGGHHSSRSSVELLEVTDNNKSPISCKPDWITDDDSSNIKKGQCGIDVSNSEFSPVQQNGTSCIEMKAESLDLKSNESEEVDVVIRKGAVSLMHLSMEHLARNQDHVPVPVPAFESCNMNYETPESSSESFASLVLKQPECNADEYCVSSSAFEVTSCNRRDSGVKVKRGRRMKDFRKEILPSLAPLSRQEIFEDRKIMELAIRPRQYKTHKSNNINKSGCSSPARSRQRACRIGRRNYC